VTEEQEEKRRGIIRAYKITFNSPSGQAVMEDLADICRFYQFLVPLHEPIMTNEVMLAEGRRQIYCQIRQIVEMPEDELIEKYRGRDPTPPEFDNG
jgi:hypothetical protein